MAEASAKAWGAAVAEVVARRRQVAEEATWPEWTASSPLPSSVAEHRSKMVHDPARRAEADARAGAEEAAARGESGDHDPEANTTAEQEVPPAADPAGGARGGDGGDREPKAAPGGGASPPRTETAPGSSRALVTMEPRATGLGLERRPAGSGTIAGSAGQPERVWAASSSEATSGAPRSELDAAVDSLQLQIANHHSQWQSFAQAETGWLRQLEQTFASIYDQRVAAYNRLLGRYRAARDQLAAKEGELRQARAAAVDPAEMETLRRQLAEAGQLRDQAAAEHSRLQEEAARAVQERDEAAAAHKAELDRLAEERRQVAAQQEEAVKKAAEEVSQLQADRDRSANALAAREREALQDALYIDELLTRFFPDTQGSAEAAVNAHRQEQMAAGVAVEEYAAWSVAEITVAAKARLEALERQMNRLFEAGLSMAAALWPGAVAPSSVSRLARWLEAGAARLNAWSASAARAGAEMALGVMLSWYPTIHLDQLRARRAGAEADLAERATAIAMRASDIASFAPYRDFVSERAPDDAQLPADDFGLELEDPEGSSAETIADADDDADELDDTATTEDSAPSDADGAVA